MMPMPAVEPADGTRMARVARSALTTVSLIYGARSTRVLVGFVVDCVKAGTPIAIADTIRVDQGGHEFAVRKAKLPAPAFGNLVVTIPAEAAFWSVKSTRRAQCRLTGRRAEGRTPSACGAFLGLDQIPCQQCWLPLYRRRVADGRPETASAIARRPFSPLSVVVSQIR